MLQLPNYIKNVCGTLEKAGFAAYAVGGCVRDLLRGECPHDYDVTTAAHPADIKRIFPHTADTGIAHGTVTVICAEGNVEVTTFRKDGNYSDQRRPDTVDFLKEIDGDLARRDFTVNAMAFSPARGFCDPFGGKADLQNKVLRAVGTPEKRFREDALRILRLYRFAAQLSFTMETETVKAAEKLLPSVLRVSRERIFAELHKLLQHASVEDLIYAKAVFRTVLPSINIEEKNLERVSACASMAGKWAHLCGGKAMDSLRVLRAPRELILSAGELAAYRSGKHIIMDVAALRHTKPEDFFAYIDDTEAQEKWKKAKESGIPMSVRDLPVNGEDVQKIGFCGKEIGEVLQSLFMYVIENPVNNNEEKLMEVLAWIYKQKSSQKA